MSDNHNKTVDSEVNEQNPEGERAEGDLSLANIQLKPLTVRVRRYSFPLEAYPLVSKEKEVVSNSREGTSDTESASKPMLSVHNKENRDNDVEEGDPAGRMSEAPAESKKKQSAGSPILCKFIDSSGLDITKQLSEASSEQKTTVKRSSLVFTSASEEDDFGDFEEDDLQSGKRITRKSRRESATSVNAVDNNTDVNNQIVQSKGLHEKLVQEFKLGLTSESDSSSDNKMDCEKPLAIVENDKSERRSQEEKTEATNTNEAKTKDLNKQAAEYQGPTLITKPTASDSTTVTVEGKDTKLVEESSSCVKPDAKDSTKTSKEANKDATPSGKSLNAKESARIIKIDVDKTKSAVQTRTVQSSTSSSPVTRAANAPKIITIRKEDLKTSTKPSSPRIITVTKNDVRRGVSPPKIITVHKPEKKSTAAQNKETKSKPETSRKDSTLAVANSTLQIFPLVKPVPATTVGKSKTPEPSKIVAGEKSSLMDVECSKINQSDSTERVFSDHDYGFRSAEERETDTNLYSRLTSISMIEEDTIKPPLHLLTSPSKHSSINTGPKVTVAPVQSQDMFVQSIVTDNPGAFSADDESSENEADVGGTPVSSSTSSTVWSSLNIIFDESAVHKKKVAESPVPRKKPEKKKILRKVASAKLRAALNETGTDTDDPGDVPSHTTRSFRKPDPDIGDSGQRAKHQSTPSRKSRTGRTKPSFSQPKISTFLEKKMKDAEQPDPETHRSTSETAKDKKTSDVETMKDVEPNPTKKEVGPVEIKKDKQSDTVKDAGKPSSKESTEVDQRPKENTEPKLTVRRSARKSEIESGNDMDVSASPAPRPIKEKSFENVETSAGNVAEKAEQRPSRRSLRDASREKAKESSARQNEMDTSMETDSEQKISLLIPSSDTESSKLDSSMDNVLQPPLGPPNFSRGDVVWVKFSSYPWWPAMITDDPSENLHVKKVMKKGVKQRWSYHVSFFGEPTRAWIYEKSILKFEGKNHLMRKRDFEIENGISVKVVNAMYTPKPNTKEKWDLAVKGAESLKRQVKDERIRAMINFNLDLTRKRKRDESATESPKEIPASKRAKIQAKIDQSVKNIPQSLLAEEGRMLTAYKLYKLGVEASKSKVATDQKSIRESWEQLSKFERKLYVESKRSIVSDLEAEEATGRRSLASKRQQEIVQQKEEKEKKEAEKGPAWYYVPINSSKEDTPVEPVPTPPEINLLEYKKYEKCCFRCEAVSSEEAGDVMKCKGLCGNSYHPVCLNLDPKEVNEDGFKCPDCTAGVLLCSLCGYSEGQINKKGNRCGPVRRCSNSGCGRWFHDACLTGSPLWPQARVGNSSLICPAHMCHTCASDDPKNPVMKFNDKLVRCIRCPTAYHHNDHCMTAGTLIITKNDILCPKHYQPPIKKGKSFTYHVNASWCFMCSTGGSLICCEICPAAFHLECLSINEPPEKYYCDNCETGRMPLYNEIVWVKIGSYRWWPAKVVPPEKLPNKIEHLEHQDGEFPVQFLGSADYIWINQGRAFLYEEGDSEKVPAMSSKTMDASFRKGLKEAEELFASYVKEKSARDLKNAGKRNFGNKPAPYVKLKANRPYGSCPVYTVDPEDLHPCDCDPHKPGPCGEDSNCINRMLMFECHPQVCNAKDLCENMRFQKRQYPQFKVHRAEGRGWGLIAQQVIKKGNFVIEYVGELITMDEYRARMKRNQEVKEENYYYLTIDNNRMIDAGPKGNAARFMNHSCDPNCITQKWSVNGDTRVGLFAIKDVNIGDELTFNYQLESVGDVKKKCLCGAQNCSGFIGEKPRNEKEERRKEQELNRIKEKKRLKKLKKKEKSKEQKRKVESKKLWESTCFRCHEGGSLIQCEMGLCPKSYHLSCIGKETFPRGKWHCPWHYCIDCGKLVEGQNAWCIHCPNAYCRQHRDSLTQHPELSWICSQHDEEIDFLLDIVRAGSGIAELFPCPNPTSEQISVWKKARGMVDSAEPVILTDDKDIKFGKGKKMKNRFSLELGESGTDTSREASLSRELTSRSETPSTLSTGSSSASSRPITPIEVDAKIVQAARQADRPATRGRDADAHKETEKSLEQARDKLAEVHTAQKEPMEGFDGTVTYDEVDEGVSFKRRCSVEPMDVDADTTTSKTPAKNSAVAGKQISPPSSKKKGRGRPPKHSLGEAAVKADDVKKDVSKAKEAKKVTDVKVICGIRTCHAYTPINSENFAWHWSRNHELPINKAWLLVDERLVNACEFFKYTLECSIPKCDVIYVSNMDPERNIKLHWSRFHSNEPAGIPRTKDSRLTRPVEKVPPPAVVTSVQQAVESGAIKSPKAPAAAARSHSSDGEDVPLSRRKSSTTSKESPGVEPRRNESCGSRRQEEPFKTPDKKQVRSTSEERPTRTSRRSEGSESRIVTRSGSPRQATPTASSTPTVRKQSAPTVPTTPTDVKPLTPTVGKQMTRSASKQVAPIVTKVEVEEPIVAVNDPRPNLNLVPKPTDGAVPTTRVSISSTTSISLHVSPSKMVTSVADIKTEVSVVWKCFESTCRYIGTDKVENMRNHLSFHGLDEERIHNLAGNLLMINMNLKMASRSIYKDASNTIVGTGPQTFVNDPERPVQGYSDYECSASECRMTFMDEANLLHHCRTVHLVKPVVGEAERPSPTKVDMAGTGFKCMMPNCSRIQQCKLGSLLFKTHWMSHPGAVFKELKYMDMETCKVLDVDEVYPFSGQCSVCNEIFTSTVSMTDVGQQIGEHWQKTHDDQSESCSYNAISFKQSVSPEKPVEKPAESSRARRSLQTKEAKTPTAVSTRSGKLTPTVVSTRSGQPTPTVSTRSGQPTPKVSARSDQPVLDKDISNWEELPSADVGKTVYDEKTADPLELKGPFRCQFGKCKQILDDAQAVFRHFKEQHSSDSLQSKSVEHVSSLRKVPVVSLYRHVLECTVHGCNRFVYRNSSQDDARRLLKNHWAREHKELKLRSFGFNNLSVAHAEGVSPVSVEEEIHLQTNPAVTSEGPFHCTAVQCEFVCYKWQSFARHWNSQHLENAADAQFVDVSTGNIVTLFDEADVVLQCKLCGVVRTCKGNFCDVVKGMVKHFNSHHKGVECTEDCYAVLKNEAGLVEEKENTLVTVSYRLAQYQGLINNGGEVVNCPGPLECLFPECNFVTSKKTILRHWLAAHGPDYTRFRVKDLHTDKVVNLQELYKCIGLCPECGLVIANNSNYETLVKGVQQHSTNKHGTTPTDFPVILPPDQAQQQTEEFEVVPLLETEDYFSLMYKGPYYCMHENCTFHSKTKDKKNIGMLLTDHWHAVHGDPREMLIYAAESNAVLNAKVVCVNLVKCKYPGCDKIFPSVYEKNLMISIFMHLLKFHKISKEERDSYIEYLPITVKKVKHSVLRKRIKEIQEPEPSGTNGGDVRDLPVEPKKMQVEPKKKKVEEPPVKAVPEKVAYEEEEEQDDQQEYDGPYVCAKCGLVIQPRVYLNSVVLQHWVSEHGNPRSLEFIDQPTGAKLDLSSFFSNVAMCAAPGCNYATGTNLCYAKIKFRVKQHVLRDHQDLQWLEDDKMVVKVMHEDDIVSCTPTDIVDPSKVYTGPWCCSIDGCDVEILSLTKGWKMKLLNHFITEHDDLFIGDFRVVDRGLQKTLRIQHIFKFVGQCNVEGCFMIKGVGGRNEMDGRYELTRSFTNHFRNEHGGAPPDFTTLVDNHRVLFATDQTESVSMPRVRVTAGPVDRKPAIKSEPGANKLADKKKKRSSAHLTISKKGSKKRRSEAAPEDTEDDDNAGQYGCEVCRALVSEQNYLDHLYTQHPSLQPLGCRVLRISDQKFLSILEFLGKIYKCGVEGCSFVSVNTSGRAQKGETAVSIEAHCKKMHRGLSVNPIPVNRLGYQCTHNNCRKISQTKIELLHHLLTHSELSALQIQFRNLDSHTDLYISNIFKYVRECEARCGQIFYDDKNKNGVDAEAARHWREVHTQMPGLPEAFNMAPVKTVIGFQCLAGYGEVDDVCNAVVPSGNLLNALKHWTYRHRDLYLRDFMFLDTSTQKFLQISDVYDIVLRCCVTDCNKVIYTLQPTPGNQTKHFNHLENRFREHMAAKHPNLDNSRTQKVYRMFRTNKFLSQSPQVEDEEVYDGGVDEECSTPLPSEGSIAGYCCGIPGCTKVVYITNVQGTSVAINRLKAHFKNKHENLTSDKFTFIPLSEHQDQEPVQLPDPMYSKPTIRRPNRTVYQCPNRSCTEVSVNFDLLREHWEQRHREYLDAVFKPTVVVDSELLHCNFPGCIEVKSNQDSYNLHLQDLHHTTSPNLVAEPVDLGLPSASEENIADEPPMVPVGRKSSKAKARQSSASGTMLPRGLISSDCDSTNSGSLKRCSFEGCSYASSSRLDLSRHRRESKHSKLSRQSTGRDTSADESGEYVCQLPGCAMRTQGIRNMEDHCEATHSDVSPSRWIYQKASEFRPRSARKRKLEEFTTALPKSNEPTVEHERAGRPGQQTGLSCAVGGNFDYSGIDANLSGEESDDMDINFY